MRGEQLAAVQEWPVGRRHAAAVEVDGCERPNKMFLVRSNCEEEEAQHRPNTPTANAWRTRVVCDQRDLKIRPANAFDVITNARKAQKHR